MHVSLFKLAPTARREGVSCDADGAFIGSVALLKRVHANGTDKWEARDTGNLSLELSRRFGLLIDITAKSAGLAAIARALNTGDVARAQMLTLFLRFPDPAAIAKPKPSRADIFKFVDQLIENDFIKANFNPNQPRWPGGAPENQGGRWSPKGTGTAPPDEPGIGHNSRNALPEEEASLAEEGIAEQAGEDLLAVLGMAAAAAGPVLVATTLPAGSANEEEELERGNEEYELHHPWPKYLGGAEDQILAKLPKSLHVQFHRELDGIAKRRWGKQFFDNESLIERTIRLQKTLALAKDFDVRYGTHLYDLMLKNGFPVP